MVTHVTHADRRLGAGTYLTILKRAWSANFKMVWYVLLRPLRPELEASWMNKFYMNDVQWKLPQLFYFRPTVSNPIM
jgi:hypothetical protein